MTQPAGPRWSAKAGLGLFFGAILFVVVALVVWPAIERITPSVQRHATVVNRSAGAIFVCAVDAGGSDAYTLSVGPGGSGRLTLALGEATTEVETRTIQLLILDERGVELGRATIPGARALTVDSIVFGGDSSIEFLGRDGKKLDVGGKAHDP